MSTEITAIDVRQALCEVAEELGWQRTRRERVDIYRRGIFHLHAIWRDDSFLNGGALYEDLIMLSYSSDLARLKSWLAR